MVVPSKTKYLDNTHIIICECLFTSSLLQNILISNQVNILVMNFITIDALSFLIRDLIIVVVNSLISSIVIIVSF